MRVTSDKQLTAVANDGFSGEMHYYQPHNTSVRSYCQSWIGGNNGGGSGNAYAGRWWFTGSYRQLADVTGIQFYLTNGATFTKGKIYVYGRSR